MLEGAFIAQNPIVVAPQDFTTNIKEMNVV